jgi:hypothetical protein
MPLTPEWSNFFTAELGALAALTGFVIVAISINLNRILANAILPGRAAESLVGPVGAIAATGLMLMPEQSAALLGAATLVERIARCDVRRLRLGLCSRRGACFDRPEGRSLLDRRRRRGLPRRSCVDLVVLMVEISR